MFRPQLKAVASIIDYVCRWVGRSVAWFTLLMALTTCLIVVARKGFGWGSIALQEAVIYMHAAVFLLAAAYTLQQDAHVRVDIFYRRFSPQTKAWVNCIGYIVFLIPFSVYLLAASLPYVETSWRICEVSADPGGIPALFILKTLIPVAAVLLILQGIADLLRQALQLVSNSHSEAD